MGPSPTPLPRSATARTNSDPLPLQQAWQTGSEGTPSTSSGGPYFQGTPRWNKSQTLIFLLQRLSLRVSPCRQRSVRRDPSPRLFRRRESATVLILEALPTAHLNFRAQISPQPPHLERRPQEAVQRGDLRAQGQSPVQAAGGGPAWFREVGTCERVGVFQILHSHGYH